MHLVENKLKRGHEFKNG